jgi:hypothetical protein
VVPEDVLHLTHKGDWKEIFFNGWREATQRHADTTWASTWIISHPHIISEQMIGLLPPEQAEEAICSWLHANNMERAVPLLERYSSPWSTKLSRAVIEAVRHSLTVKKENRRAAARMQQLFAILPYRIAPALAEEAAAAWKKAEGESWIMHENYLRVPLAILQFRHDMLEALRHKQAH